MIIKYVTNNDSYIQFPSLQIPNTKVAMFSDVSFNIHPDGSSQGGYIIIQVDKYNKSCPMSWSQIKFAE